MSEDRPKKKLDGMDEDEFEASLVDKIDPELINAATQIIPESSSQISITKPEEKQIENQPSWTGKILSHFKLLRLIGQGRMGRVIQAEDITLKRIVALKILNKRIPGVDQQEKVNQFLREARSAAQIEHPNVVRIFEINQYKGWWYIAMELLEENLRRIVEAAGPLPPAKACWIIADAASGLAVAHSLGIVHRDIKPTNLMLTRHGRCKLTDFGLVRLDDPNDPFDFTDRAVGSPYFVAPEMLHSRQQSPAIDVYGLGATLFFALTGSPPYKGTDVKEVFKKHIKAPIPDIRELAPELPLSLAKLIKRTLSKEPTKRPTAANFAAALRPEAITWQGNGSSVLSGTGTDYLIPSITGEARRASASLDEAPTKQKHKPLQNLKNHTWSILSGVGILVIVLTLILLTRINYPESKSEPIPSEDILSKAFSDSRPSYGILPAGSNPTTASVVYAVPEFSWVGKVDTSNILYVASTKGTHFYAAESPEAALIRLENFVGYETIEQALADGKRPAE